MTEEDYNRLWDYQDCTTVRALADDELARLPAYLRAQVERRRAELDDLKGERRPT